MQSRELFGGVSRISGDELSSSVGVFFLLRFSCASWRLLLRVTMASSGTAMAAGVGRQPVVQKSKLYETQSVSTAGSR